MNKFKLMDKVQMSRLSDKQKNLLTYLILRADEHGESFPLVATLCKVTGITHEKNFKGVTHYLGDLVTVKKVGKQNHYFLNTPAIEGLSQAEVVLKETPSRSNTPAVEGVLEEAVEDDTPAHEGVTLINTPAHEGGYTPAVEGVNTPASEGTYSSRDSSRDNSIERHSSMAPAEPVATADASTTLLLDTRQGDDDTPLVEEESEVEDTKALRASFDPMENRRYRELTSSAAWGGMKPEDAVRLIIKERDMDEW